MLELVDVGMWLPQRGVLARHLDLAVEPGQVALLAGRNGSGTSTLLRGITGRGEPGSRREGAVRWGSLDLTDARPDELTGAVVLVPERIPPSSLTIADVLELGTRERTDGPPAPFRADLVERLGLTDHLGRSLRAAPGSVGQRAVIASALLTGPHLLLCDQVLAPLETAWRDEVAALLREQADAGAVVVCAEHELATAVQVADVVLELGADTGAQPAATWRPSTLPWTPLQQVASALGVPARSVDDLREALAGRLPRLLGSARGRRRDAGALMLAVQGERIRIPDAGCTVVACADAADVPRLAHEITKDNGIDRLQVPTGLPVRELARRVDRRRSLDAGTTLRALRELVPTLRDGATLDDHSAGERARVVTALAGTGQPRLLVEPERHLDGAARVAQRDEWRRARAAIVALTTDAEALTWADQVVVPGLRLVASSSLSQQEDTVASSSLNQQGDAVAAGPRVGSPTALLDVAPALPQLSRATAPLAVVRADDVLSLLEEENRHG